MAVTELCREIRQAVDARTEVYFLGLFTPATSWLFGVDFADITNEVDGIVVCCYDSPVAQVGEDMRMSRMELQHKQEKRVLTGLRVFYPEVRNEEDFRHKVKAAVDAGTDGFVFYNYGLIPAGRLDWVRRSIMADLGLLSVAVSTLLGTTGHDRKDCLRWVRFIPYWAWWNRRTWVSL